MARQPWENSPTPLDGEPAHSDFEKCVEVLINTGLYIVDNEHGPNGRAPKEYHGTEHSIEVVQAAITLGYEAAKNGRISERERLLLAIAAAFHDTVYVPGAADNEVCSAELARYHMGALGFFTPEDIRAVGEMIGSTTVVDVTDSRIIQSVEGKSYAARLMADADLHSFGAPLPAYWASARRFFAETQPEQQLSGAVLHSFAERQIRMVGNHQYHTEEARTLFNNQSENIRYLRELQAAA